MYIRRSLPRLAGAVFVVFVGASDPRPVGAQTTAPAGQQHQHGQEPPPAGQQHEGHAGADMAQMAREGSGTSWLPDVTPMYAIHAQKGAWEFMAHENVFVQFLHESGRGGTDQTGSINWFMGMANRNVGTGRLGLRGMFSLEPWTIRGCGYPDLLATGEQCDRDTIHDRQHPHDLAMEIAATYDAPLKGPIRWQVYGGPAGEPALGPVAYPHRVSAMPNPLAPIAHHWLDSTHVTFGVVTAGLYGTRWKAEASAFNGREPDEQRAGLDLAALDSVSGRVSFLPTQNLALQVSTGRLTEAEPSDTGGSRIDVTRVTASATYHRTLGGDGIWASTVAWGRNSELDHASNALLLESNLTLDDRHTWFGRFEVAAKSARDLEVRGDDTFNVSKLQGGYIRYAGAWNGLAPGLGMSASVGFVPDSLKAAYGSRANLGVGVFVTLRPMVMMHASATGGTAAPVDHSQHAAEPAAPVDHSQHVAQPSAPAAPPAGQNTPRLPVAAAERVIDPRCARTIDLANAPRATYQSKVYYFCSTADRDEFVKDPAAYLKNRAN